MSQVPDFVNVVDTPWDIKALYNDSLKFNKYTIVKFVGTLFSYINSKWHNEQKGFRWKNFYKSRIAPLDKHYDVAIAYTAGEMMYYVKDKVVADKKVVIVHNDYRSGHYPKKFDYDYFVDMDRICSISKSCVDILKEEFPEFIEKIKLLPNISSSQLIKKERWTFILLNTVVIILKFCL